MTAGPDVGELRWTLVVPLKAPQEGKSRLAWWLEPDQRTALVRAMVGDTLAAAAGAEQVDRIVVVTADVATGRYARRVAAAVDVDVVREPLPADLNKAVRAGIARARILAPADGVGVLLGDLPALRSADLDDVLARAARHPLAFVTDATGTGTTLLTACPGVPVYPAFGAGSARAHLSRGHVAIEPAVGSGIAHDVDVPDDLGAAIALGVGRRTRRSLRGVAARPA
jgi:2-phospho-L-lactate guanylyltransferase